MSTTSQITDNITELLVKIIEFTQQRQKILTLNINNINRKGYIPADLAVNEFSCLLLQAINEHNKRKRLVLCDTENITFGTNGSFQVKAVIDKNASGLLEKNPDEYLELQINKLLENSLNQKVAAELLKQKGMPVSDFE